MQFREKDGNYITAIGQYWSFRVSEDGRILKNKRTAKFVLSKDKDIAAARERAINEEWTKCRRSGAWKSENIERLRVEGIIPKKKAESILADAPTKIARSLEKSERNFKTSMTTKEIKDAESFGEWIIVTLTQKLKTKRFQNQLEVAIEKVAEHDPIAAARLWLDFSERIFGDKPKYAVNNNISGVAVFGSSGQFVPEPIDTTSRESEETERDLTIEENESESE